MVCYKSANLDPVKDSTATVLWRDPPVNQPEQTLVGVQYTAHLQNDGKGAIYIVQNSSNWVWEGTGFATAPRSPGFSATRSDRLMSAVSGAGEHQLHNPVGVAGRRRRRRTGIAQHPRSTRRRAARGCSRSGTNHWSFGLGQARRDRLRDPAGNQPTCSNRFVETVPPPPTPPPAPSAC